MARNTALKLLWNRYLLILCNL